MTMTMDMDGCLEISNVKFYKGRLIKDFLQFFPEKSEEVEACIMEYGQVLETVIIEDIFCPELLSLILNDKNEGLLDEIFKLIENILNTGSEHQIDVISVTIIEHLGDDAAIFQKSQKYMGSSTKMKLEEVNYALGRKSSEFD